MFYFFFIEGDEKKRNRREDERGEEEVWSFDRGEKEEKDKENIKLNILIFFLRLIFINDRD